MTDDETQEPIVVVGASGHAKVVIELLRAAARHRVIACVDPRVGGTVLGVPVVGGDDALPRLLGAGVRYAFVAIGDNATRRRVTGELRALGFLIGSAISPRAAISPSASIGEGTAVMAGATVNAEATIGEGAIVNTNASVDHDCVVGSFVHCGPGTHLAADVRIGDGALLGVGVSAIPGVRIGAWAVIGAGGVVIGEIPPGVTAVGVPARPGGSQV